MRIAIAVHLQDFLNTYSLIHAPSQTPLVSLTYKEMTCTRWISLLSSRPPCSYRIVSPDNPAGWGFAAAILLRNPPKIHIGRFPTARSKPHLQMSLFSLKSGVQITQVNLRRLLSCLIIFFIMPISPLVLISRSTQTLNMPCALSWEIQLVTLAQQCFTALRTLHHVTLSKVAGHSGILGNKLADSLAKGIHEYGFLGRFSGHCTAALSPPDTILCPTSGKTFMATARFLRKDFRPLISLLKEN